MLRTSVDPFKDQMKQMDAIKHRLSKARTNADRVDLLVQALREWPNDRLGEWQDAAAVAGRRKNVPSWNSYSLLVRLTAGLPDDANLSRRVCEIANSVEKLLGRPSHAVREELSKVQGPKAMALSSTRPSRRPRIGKDGAFRKAPKCD